MTIVDDDLPEKGEAENKAPKTRMINEEEINHNQDSEAESEIESQPGEIKQQKPETGIIIPQKEAEEESQPVETSLQTHDGESIPPPPSDVVDNEYTLPTSEERTWASIAHLSILLNLFTVFLGPLVGLVIYLVYKDKSRYIAYHAMQALVFQLAFWIGAGIIASFVWIVSLLTLIIIVGCCLLPVAVFFSFVPIAALVYGVIGGIETSQGRDFKYWLVGDWVRGILEQ